MNKDALEFRAPLRTERLVLRNLLPKDAEPIFRLRTDENVNALIGRKSPADMNGAVDFINKILNNQMCYWAITINDELIGTICLFNMADDHSEVGFEILPAYRRQGFIQESFNAVRDFAFNQLKLTYLIAVVNNANTNSLNFLMKNGFNRPLIDLPDTSENEIILQLLNPNSSV